MLWAGLVALSAAASFAAGVAYGIPIVSVESHYDLERIVHSLFWEMRESDMYLTHLNYMLLTSADWDADMIALYPNVDNGSSSGTSWSLERTIYTSSHPNGTRLYKMLDPEGNTLREVAFHGERDKVVMAAIIDYKADYLTASERDRINEESGRRTRTTRIHRCAPKAPTPRHPCTSTPTNWPPCPQSGMP